MATTRRETLERKNALLRDLRSVHHHGVALPGEMALSQRELSAKYGLSMRTVSIELQKLVEEGVLYTVARVGTFVGRPQTARHQLFLALFRYLDEPNTQWSAIRAGFEDRIANLGGTSLVLDFETARACREAGEIVAPAGIFEFHDENVEAIWSEPGIAHVEFGELPRVHVGSDGVYFDNPDGGWKATRHLLSLGHRRIAFLGLHAAQEDPGFLLWSQEREDGWRRALQEANLSSEGLAFQPDHMTSMIGDELVEIASGIAAQILKREDISAVVVVNNFAAQGLFQCLRLQERPSETWPAIVGFDVEVGSPTADELQGISALRLPWEEIGREVANLLWERSQGRLDSPQQRLVPMTLIPRLSCRKEWHRAPGATFRRENGFPQLPDLGGAARVY